MTERSKEGKAEEAALEQKKQRVLKTLETLRDRADAELDTDKQKILEFWHKLVAEEAELVLELRNENQILKAIMGGAGLAYAIDDTGSSTDDGITAQDDSTPRDS